MSFVGSLSGSSSGVCLKQTTSESSASLPETGCLDVPHTVSTVRRLKGWRRLSLTFMLSRRFRNVAKMKKLKELQQADVNVWVGRAWLTLSRLKSASVLVIGHLGNPHEVGMGVQAANSRELLSELNQSRRFRLVKLDQEAKVALLTRRAALRFVRSLQRQQFRVAVLTVQAALRLVNPLRPPKACRWYNDPITFEKMCDPVKCNDGRTYDRWTVICNKIPISPFTRKPFAIAVDDIDVRSWLFSTFSEQESQFHCKRADYRAKALQHARSNPVDVDSAVEMLNNVLQWAPEDTECLNELDLILTSISCQSCQSHSLLQGSDSEVEDVSEVSATLEGSQPDRLSTLGSTLRHRLPQGRDIQTYVIPTIRHEDLARERYPAERLPPCLLFIFIYMVGFFLLESQSRI